jgi:predicted PurR-regulated permease PerM
MTAPIDEESERRAASRLMDVLIHAGLLAAMVVLCYQVFSPFLTLMVWALILAVAMYPLHQWIARRMKGKQGLAATALVLVGVLVIVTPAAVLMNSFGDSVRTFIESVQNDTLNVPPPKPGVEKWPVIGKRVYAVWTQAHTDMPGLVRSLQPKVGELARRALSTVASIGLGLLGFLASLIIAGIMMAYGEAGARTVRAIFDKVVGLERGEKLARLSTATIRTVAQGVLGVAFIQAAVIGIALLIAGVPWAGLLSAVALVLAIAQVPTLLVTLPAIGYIWTSDHQSSGVAVVYTIILLLAGLIDNVLKPLLLGRGVEAPMPVILLGALGGMASDGILGMFVGATLLALGYQIFMGWVARPAAPTAAPAGGGGGTTTAT